MIRNMHNALHLQIMGIAAAPRLRFVEVVVKPQQTIRVSLALQSKFSLGKCYKGCPRMYHVIILFGEIHATPLPGEARARAASSPART